MKRHGYTLRKTIVGILLMLATGTAYAQIGGDVLKVKIPFDFTVGKRTFPAGQYSLRPLLPNTMLLRNQSGQVLTSIATNSVESAEVSRAVKLVFTDTAGNTSWPRSGNRGTALGKN